MKNPVKKVSIDLRMMFCSGGISLEGEDRFLPHTLGHEGVGVVREVGAGVVKVAQGDQRVLTWLVGHGANVPAAQYTYQQRVVNSGAISTFLQYAVISENRVIRSPNGVPVPLLPLLGCAVPTGMGIVLNTLRLQPGQSIAIWGPEALACPRCWARWPANVRRLL